MKQTGHKIWDIIEQIIRISLQWILHFLHKELSDEMLKSCMQFIKFGIVGVSNTILNYVLYLLSLLLFRSVGIFPKYDIYFAQMIAFILSVLWSFYWNNRMVFGLQEGERRTLWKSLLKTYVSYSVTGVFLNSILLYLWVQVLQISEFVAPIFNLLISVPLNFIINKFWAFRSEKE